MTEFAKNENGEWIYREYINREMLLVHAPYESEMDFYTAVKSGDEERVRDFLKEPFSATPGLGVLSDDRLRNFKYHFTIAVAMISRTCIDAGLPHEKAYSLSDFYIQKVDRMKELADIDRLHDEMVMEYTRLMSDLRVENVPSKNIARCINHIYSHLHMRITLPELAKVAGVSESHLSRSFKKETGMSVSEYIEHQKLETAKNMLRYSDYSIGEISAILGFPSQSYFTERFAKKTGTTPHKWKMEQ